MKLLILIFTALAASSSAADGPGFAEFVTTLSTPSEYCFPQGIIGVRGPDRTILYNLVVRAEDVGKQGDIFVKLSDGSTNGDWWMLPKTKTAGYVSYTQPTASSWAYATGTSTPQAFSSGALQLITFIDIAVNPVDVSSVAGVGALYVGYGLRTSTTSSLDDSFREMLANRRLALVWRVNNQSLYSTSAPTSKDPIYEAGDPMCVTITQIKRIFPILYPASQETKATPD